MAPERSNASGGITRSWIPVAVHGERVRLHAAAASPDGAPRTPLLLLHGMASSWRQWRRTLLRLGAEMPLAALDFPGFGASDQPRRPLAAPDYADACEAWCRVQGWPAVSAVGHSFGGAVLVDWAARYPSRFRSVGLIAPAAVYHPWHSAGGGVIRWPVAGRVLLPLFVWLISTHALGPRYFGHITAAGLQGLQADEVTDLQWGCRRAREMLRALDYYRFPQLEQQLEAIRAPVVLGWGTQDRVVPYGDAAIFTAHLHQPRLVTWEGCGHVPMLERPAECDDLLRAVARGAAAGGAA